MSISTLTTLGAVRDHSAPKKKDIGKASANDDANARITDTLVSAIPTEVVTAYTAAVALVVGLINDNHKDQFRNLRWGMFAALILITAVSVYVSYRAKSTKRQPLEEIAAGVMAAAVWGLSLPDSPLIPVLHGDNKTLVPGLVLLGGGTVLIALANLLTKPAATKQIRKVRGTARLHHPASGPQSSAS